jgi:hypothetical protein
MSMSGPFPGCPSPRSGFVRLLHRSGQDLGGLEELAATVDVDVLGLDGVGPDEAPFDELVGRPPDQLPVLEGPGLRLVGVAER